MTGEPCRGTVSGQGRDREIKLRFRWTGAGPPRVGCFLMARRGRTAYEVTRVRLAAGGLHVEAATGRVRPADGVWRGVFTVVRWELREVPGGATMYEWVWDKR